MRGVSARGEEADRNAALIEQLAWALRLTMSDAEQCGQIIYGPKTTVREALRAFDAWKADLQGSNCVRRAGVSP